MPCLGRCHIKDPCITPVTIYLKPHTGPHFLRFLLCFWMGSNNHLHRRPCRGKWKGSARKKRWTWGCDVRERNLLGLLTCKGPKRMTFFIFFLVDLDGIICLSNHVLKPRALVCVCETQFEDASHLTTSETRASLNLLFGSMLGHWYGARCHLCVMNKSWC